MINIPTDLLARFESALTKKSVPIEQRNYYKKWLRYYLDFCQKYKQPISAKESLQQFIKKLQEKNQTPEQQKRVSTHTFRHSFATHLLQANYDTGQGGHPILFLSREKVRKNKIFKNNELKPGPLFVNTPPSESSESVDGFLVVSTNLSL